MLTDGKRCLKAEEFSQFFFTLFLNLLGAHFSFLSAYISFIFTFLYIPHRRETD
jgi:hypothetical protein